MGYAVSARFRDIQERDRMLEFLGQEGAEILGKIRDREKGLVSRLGEALRGEDLGPYAPGGRETLAGFAGSAPGRSTTAVCAWMASRSERRKAGCGVMYWDREEILVKKPEQWDAAAKSATKVGDRGEPVEPRRGSGFWGLAHWLMVKGREKRLAEDIRELDAAWEAWLAKPARKAREEAREIEEALGARRRRGEGDGAEDRPGRRMEAK